MTLSELPRGSGMMMMMMMMDQLEEISIKLEKSHLAYLQTDESPLKLKQRQKLEGFIKEYLYLVPHENKYIFPETAHILHRSAATVNEFSGYRACSAWTAISLYAANLLAQPWRKEYRTLRTYSGFYKHEIEANLVGAELMFELMGYKHTGLGVLSLEGPIDPDKVSYVSRDAIVAFVECQIIKEIWEKVSQIFTISWLQVLEFREKHVGTPEQAVRALNHRFCEQMYQNRPKLQQQNYYDLHFAQPTALIDTTIDATPALPTTSPHTVINNYNKLTTHNIPLDTNNYHYSPENIRYYQSFQVPLVNGYHHNIYNAGIPMIGSSRVYPNEMYRDYYVHNMPNYETKIPTGQLIELQDAAPIPVINYEKSSRNKRRQYCNNNNNYKSMDQVDMAFSSRPEDNNYSSSSGSSNKIDRKGIKTSTSLDSACNETWDFVYQSLDNIRGTAGYGKDVLGDRDDILRKKNNLKFSSQITKDYDDKYDSHHLKAHKKHQSNSNLDAKSPLHLIDLNVHTTDGNDNNSVVADDKIAKYSAATGGTSRNTMKNYEQIIVDLASNALIQPSRLDEDQQPKNNKKNAGDGKWNCSTCTYLNTADREICEMCNKSRWKGNEDKPLASGGKECPQCTLVNEKNASKCDACGASLKDSPTYI